MTIDLRLGGAMCEAADSFAQHMAEDDGAAADVKFKAGSGKGDNAKPGRFSVTIPVTKSEGGGSSDVKIDVPEDCAEVVAERLAVLFRKSAFDDRDSVRPIRAHQDVGEMGG